MQFNIIKSRTDYNINHSVTLFWNFKYHGFLTGVPGYVTVNPFRAKTFQNKNHSEEGVLYTFYLAHFLPAESRFQQLLEISGRSIVWRFVPRVGSREGIPFSCASSVTDVYAASLPYIRSEMSKGNPFPTIAWLRSYMLNVDLYTNVEDIVMMDLPTA
jgi:hypothetical protein